MRKIRLFKVGKKAVKGKKLDLNRIISKRKRFVIVSLTLTAFLVFIQLSEPKDRVVLTTIFGFLTYFLFWFGLWEDIDKIEWLTLFTLPVLFSITVSLWYFLLPVRWITRLAVAIPYGVIIYFLLLAENINNVAVARTIQLARVAKTVGSFISILTGFMFFWTLFSFDLAFYWNFLLIFGFCFLVAVSFYWNFKLSGGIGKSVFFFAFVAALAVSQMGWIFSFWPVESLMMTLFLSTIFYGFLEIGENYFLQRPIANFLPVYLFGVIGVLILMIISTSWG